MSKKRQARLGARDAETGLFIPLEEARKHPKTTVREHIPLPGYGDTGRGTKKGK